MEDLEIHTLLCKRDVQWYIYSIRLFKEYSKLKFTTIIHDDGTLETEDIVNLTSEIEHLIIIDRNIADECIEKHLQNHTYCRKFRLAQYHTIFRIKLFDPFIFTKSHNIIYMDADILFCKKPHVINYSINNKNGFYIKDSWSSYCIPFRDENNDTQIDRFINAGLTYFPTKEHYNLNYVEKCLKILYKHGAENITHQFLEQTCIAYMITQLKREGIQFNQLPHPEYCIPTFGKFIQEHNLTVLHLNSSRLVGSFKNEHYEYELNKL